VNSLASGAVSTAKLQSCPEEKSFQPEPLRGENDQTR
jgi:hypothetical protein